MSDSLSKGRRDAIATANRKKHLFSRACANNHCAFLLFFAVPILSPSRCLKNLGK